MKLGPQTELDINIFLSLFIGITIFIIRFITVKIIHKVIEDRETRRRYYVHLNSLITVAFFAALIILWSSQIKTLTVSLLVIAVPIVLAGKELFASMAGGFLKLTSGSFQIGDRIEIGRHRGDVVGKTLLTTKLLEIGPGKKTHQYTGRSITIPNANFLDQPVINESFLKNFVLHPFEINLKRDENWEKAQSLLIEICNRHCEEYYEQAQIYIDRLQSKASLHTPGIRPRVHIRLPDPQQIQFIVRITIPADLKGTIEQKIITDFLREF